MRYIDKHDDRNDFISIQNELNRLNKKGAPVVYRTENVVRYLTAYYKGRCAYCGCDIKEGSSFHIEHFYPKTDKGGYPPEFSYDLRNLHYSCPACNESKGKRDPNHVLKKIKRGEKTSGPIYSPNFYYDKDWKKYNKIDLYKAFSYKGPFITPALGDEKAERSIYFFNLNNDNPAVSSRQYLVDSRIRVYCEVAEMMRTLLDIMVKCNMDRSLVGTVKDVVNYLIKAIYQKMNQYSRFSEMVEDNFSEGFLKLLKIWTKLSSQS